MTALNKQAIDFSQPLETENGEPVKYICHDVIEYKCARVCVDIATGVVYSSPYVGLKIRNKETTQRAKLREQIESAADVYWQFDNGWISDMKCGDLSHEYLLFVKDPKNVLALLDELEAAERRNAELDSDNAYIKNRHKELDLLIGKNILVMQAAIIEWQGTGDARKGLAWIYNTLFGPGELPSEDEKDAQAYFDRKYAPLDEELMNLHQWFWEQSEAERAAAAGITVKGE